MSHRVGLEIMLASGSEPGGHTEMAGDESAQTFTFSFQLIGVEFVTVLCRKNTDIGEQAIDTPAITLTTIQRNLQ